MKRYILLFVCLASSFATLSAQAVDTTVCNILSNPQSFDGKIVQIKGLVMAGFDEFAIKDPSCKQPINAIWLAYPEGAKGKAGPVALLRLQLASNSPGTALQPTRTAVQLNRDKEFKQFDSLLSTPFKSNGMCLGCGKYIVTATLVGRLDGVAHPGISRDSAGKFVSATGFGNMNRYAARLVLQSVTDVTSQEIDYAKAELAAKDDTEQTASTGDPIAAAREEAHAFKSGTSPAEQIGRAVDAFGKPGEDNGVNVNFGASNEVPKNEGAKGSGNSPDGLLFNCTFQMDRLKGDALSTALIHVGTHIADIRGNQPDIDLFHAEYGAWQSTVLSAVAARHKTLTLPGGYLVWNAAWAPSDRSNLADDGIVSFLSTWEGLERQ